jgi:hypothetical protein
MTTRFLSRLPGWAALLATPLTLHAQNSLYEPESAALFIPSIDAAQGQSGYHDARLEFVRDDLWRLTHITPASELRSVYEVRVIETDTFPVQVLLEVDGVVGYTCSKLHIEKRRVDDTFHVSIQQEESLPGTACIALAADFSWVVPLDVYGLPAGEYQYVVNHGLGPVEHRLDGTSVDVGVGLTGSFVLDADNVLARPAPEFPRYIPPKVVQLSPP